MLRVAVEVMVGLNDRAAQAALSVGAHAMTDVTGFGLLGHLHHLCRESRLAAELDAGSVPIIKGVEKQLESEEGVSGGSRCNAEWATDFTIVEPSVMPWQVRLLTDATTSGGLLAAFPASAAGGCRVQSPDASLRARPARSACGPAGERDSAPDLHGVARSRCSERPSKAVAAS